MSHLYEITGQMRELAELADTDADLAVAVSDTMQAMAGEFNEKALAVSHVILNFGADIAALDSEIERLKARKNVITNRQASIKDYLRTNMEAAQMTKISCPLFSITLGKGRESVVIDSEADIPDDLMRVTTSMTPDKKAITDLIKSGKEVPGAHLERGQSSITIK